MALKLRKGILWALTLCLSACALEPSWKLPYQRRVDKQATRKPFTKTANKTSWDSYSWLKHQAELGNVDAQARLGQWLLEGQGGVKDAPQAIKWFRKAAARGSAYAQWQLGNCYRQGIEVPRDALLSRHWLERSARQNELNAILALIEMNEGHEGVKRNEDAMVVWSQAAIRIGSPEAEHKLGVLLKQNPELIKRHPGSLIYLKDAAAAQHPEALVRLGELQVETIKPNGSNAQSAFEYYQLAANRGNGEAAYKLALLYEKGEGVKQSWKMSREWLEKAAKLDIVLAQEKLGDYYHLGYELARNESLSAYWYRKAASSGLKQAQVKLGDCYHAGRGVPRYLEQAVFWYQKAAEQNDAYAQFMLSIFYSKGRGVELDLKTSLMWHDKAMQHSTRYHAMVAIADHYLKGDGFSRNPEEAFRWTLRAGEGNDAVAQVQLGELYAQGLGVTQDFEQAYNWYLRAAKQGSSYAEYALGLLCLEGRGREVDLISAATWFKRAAMKGARQAQYQLGLLYLEGRGVGQNDVKAYHWLTLALDQQQDAMPQELEKLLNSMEPDARGKALKLVERYQKQHGDYVRSPIL